MNLLTQVVEDKRYLEAQHAVRQFSIYDAKRDVSLADLKETEGLDVVKILQSQVRRSLFGRYLKNSGSGINLLLFHDALHELNDVPPGARQALLLRRLNAKYLNKSAIYYIGRSSDESMEEKIAKCYSTVQELLKNPNPESLSVPDFEMEELMDYVISRMSELVEGFRTSSYGESLARFEKFARKPRKLSDYERLRVLGEGGFGKVSAVTTMDTGALYALKEMGKVKVISKNRVNTVINEVKILKKCDYPFVARLHQVFHDEVSIYFILDVLIGGELKYHLKRMPTINHKVSQFWAACLVLGIKYLHDQNIIHRDLKPSNAILDGDGYVVISDFGLSVTADTRDELRHEQCCGTPGYIAPEMYLGPCWDRRKQRSDSKRRESDRKSSIVGQMLNFPSSFISFRGRATSSKVLPSDLVGQQPVIQETKEMQRMNTDFIANQHPGGDGQELLNDFEALHSKKFKETVITNRSNSNRTLLKQDSSKVGLLTAGGKSFQSRSTRLLQNPHLEDIHGGTSTGGGKDDLLEPGSPLGPDEGFEGVRFPRYEYYGISVDIFALGVILHQFYCLGRLPFTRGPKKSHRYLLKGMIQGKVRWSESCLAQMEKNTELVKDTANKAPLVGLTEEAKDLIEKLLHHDPNKRLGCGPEGHQEIMDHPFFEGIDWDKLERKHIVPPFVPPSNTVNAEFQQGEWEVQEPTNREKRKSLALQDEKHRKIFEDIEYVRTETFFEELASCQVNFEAKPPPPPSDPKNSGCIIS